MSIPAIPMKMPITIIYELESALAMLMLLIPQANKLKPKTHRIAPANVAFVPNLLIVRLWTVSGKKR